MFPTNSQQKYQVQFTNPHVQAIAESVLTEDEIRDLIVNPGTMMSMAPPTLPELRAAIRARIEKEKAMLARQELLLQLTEMALTLAGGDSEKILSYKGR